MGGLGTGSIYWLFPQAIGKLKAKNCGFDEEHSHPHPHPLNFITSMLWTEMGLYWVNMLPYASTHWSFIEKFNPKPDVLYMELAHCTGGVWWRKRMCGDGGLLWSELASPLPTEGRGGVQCSFHGAHCMALVGGEEKWKRKKSFVSCPKEAALLLRVPRVSPSVMSAAPRKSPSKWRARERSGKSFKK